MITTFQNVKKLLQITDSSNDALILELMPIVQRQIIDYTNNRFLDSNVWLTSSGFTFNDASPATITDDDSGFSDAMFYSGMEIFVTGSYNNDGYYTTKTVTAGTITLESYESLISEDKDNAVAIYKVDFPKSLKMIFAKMINFNLQKSATEGIKSQTLGDYSVTYVDVGGNDYPASVVGGLKSFRRLKCR